MVDRDEAQLGHPREKVSPIDENHSNIVKFPGIYDRNYQTVVRCISEQLRNIGRTEFSILNVWSQLTKQLMCQ